MGLTQEEYANTHGSKCPFCGSDNIEADHFDGESASQPVECLDCGKRWVDCYKLTGYEVIKQGELMEIDVKAIRKAAGLTQPELARKLDVEAVTVSRWERGVSRPHRSMVKKMLRLQKRAEGKGER